MKKIYEGDASLLDKEKRKQLALQAISDVIAKTLEYSGQVVLSIAGSVREPEEYEKAYQCVQDANDHLEQALEALD